MTAFEKRHRDRANKLAREENWQGAAAEWEILLLLRPESVEYRTRLEEAKAKADAGLKSWMQAAAEARNRGDVRDASSAYLRVLAADPANVSAADALREIEREQALRRHAATWVAAAPSKPGPRTRPPADRISPVEQQELESAFMLLRQGDYSVALRKLQDYLRRHPNDDLARKALRDAYAGLGKQRLDQGKSEEALGYLKKAQQVEQPGATPSVESLRKDLAQDYYEKGVRVQRSDLVEAIRVWELALTLDPDHPQAGLRLKQARQMQRNLESIEGARPGGGAKP